MNILNIYMKKLLDLSEDCVKTLSKRAIDEDTDFKNLAQMLMCHYICCISWCGLNRQKLII
jgi:hypothetical protein